MKSNYSVKTKESERSRSTSRGSDDKPRVSRTRSSRNQASTSRLKSKGFDSKKSGAWLQTLFSKQDDELPNMPEWYYKNVLNKKSSIPIRKKGRKTPPFVPIIHDRKCAPVDLENVRQINSFCKGNLTKISLGLEKLKETLPGKTDSTTPLSLPKLKRKRNAIKLMMERINQRVHEALQLLMKKLEEGLLPTTNRLKCDAEYQYGITISPKPSVVPPKCFDADTPMNSTSEFSSMDNNPDIDGTQPQSLQTVVNELTSYLDTMEDPGESCLDDVFGAYTPVMDFEIERYLQEPVAEYLLMSVGAMDERGHLRCDYTDFDTVEHAVKSLMVNLAKEHFKAHVEKAKRLQSQLINEGIEGEYNIKQYRRDTLEGILKAEMKSQFPERGKAEEKVSKPKPRVTIYRDSIPNPIPPLVTEVRHKRANRSELQEKLAFQIASQIAVSLNKMDQQRSSLDMEQDDSLTEIMPFQYRESFDVEHFDHLEHHEHRHESHGHVHRKSTPIQLQESVKSEFHAWAHKPLIPKNPDFPEDHKRPRSMQEWINRKTLEEFAPDTNISNLSTEDRVVFLMLKYTLKWMEMTRKNLPIRKYYPCKMKALWTGRYPPYMIRRIQTVNGLDHYQPKDIKDFYAAVRKLEAKMYNGIETRMKIFLAGGDPVPTESSESSEKPGTEATDQHITDHLHHDHLHHDHEEEEETTAEDIQTHPTDPTKTSEVHKKEKSSSDSSSSLEKPGGIHDLFSVHNIATESIIFEDDQDDDSPEIDENSPDIDENEESFEEFEDDLRLLLELDNELLLEKQLEHDRVMEDFHKHEHDDKMLTGHHKKTYDKAVVDLKKALEHVEVVEDHHKVDHERHVQELEHAVEHFAVEFQRPSHHAVQVVEELKHALEHVVEDHVEQHEHGKVVEDLKHALHVVEEHHPAEHVQHHHEHDDFKSEGLKHILDNVHVPGQHHQHHEPSGEHHHEQEHDLTGEHKHDHDLAAEHQHKQEHDLAGAHHIKSHDHDLAGEHHHKQEHNLAGAHHIKSHDHDLAGEHHHKQEHNHAGEHPHSSNQHPSENSSSHVPKHPK